MVRNMSTWPLLWLLSRGGWWALAGTPITLFAGLAFRQIISAQVAHDACMDTQGKLTHAESEPCCQVCVLILKSYYCLLPCAVAPPGLGRLTQIQIHLHHVQVAWVLLANSFQLSAAFWGAFSAVAAMVLYALWLLSTASQSPGRSEGHSQSSFGSGHHSDEAPRSRALGELLPLSPHV